MRSGSLALAVLLLLHGYSLAESPTTGEQAAGTPDSYTTTLKPLFRGRCYSCHGSRKQSGGLRMDTVAAIRSGGDSGPAIDVNAPDESVLLERLLAHDEEYRMPPEAKAISPSKIRLVRDWISSGAIAPGDEVGEPDPESHWAFQALPATFPANASIDYFIDLRLQQRSLTPVPPANSVDLVRRMFLDMHGLPPSPQALAFWTRELNGDALQRQAAVGRLADHLLSSPRYGERWAQYWLDLVRYADTHGFEVNTPRETAWPYRDYVIRAFNDDLPYDQFIREQLAGDTFEEDAATGFLVCSAVLLPGQIGKDDASKRLARQDALDEIVVGTANTFLGLTLGCARCHDHKFDPLTQEDYYAFQAHFAGVEYGQRVWRNEQYQENRRRLPKIESRLAEIDRELTAVTPLASSDEFLWIDDEEAELTTVLAKPRGHGANPGGNSRGYRDDVGDIGRLPNLSGGRYTWWTNEPGQDVFTWDPQRVGKYRIWISWGVHGSGVHTRDARYVLDRDGDLESTDDQTQIATADQFFYTGQTTGDSEKTPRWSGLLEVGIWELEKNSRIILRGGETGTGITADVLLLQSASTSEGSENPLKPQLPNLRSPVSPLRNIERFAPRPAKWVRFRALQTVEQNRHEPCIDELEIFGPETPGKNLALGASGARASSSGNYSDTGKHQLRHINDGRFGNDFSWISDEKGGGWVSIELPESRLIDRIQWSRDRNGKYKDRLATEYELEVSVDGNEWERVAGSADRIPFDAPHSLTVTLRRNASLARQPALDSLISESASLEKQRAEYQQDPQVFGGVFRAPDTTFLLRRGDSEQPLREVSPSVPKIIQQFAARTSTVGSSPSSKRRAAAAQESDTVVGFTGNFTEEQGRRRRLAEWIADPANPLTPRVIVNRIWLHHFGRGLVETPSDFGMLGTAPSHPLLLDWLAAEFVSGGWSIKQLHRQILTSSAYQRSHEIDPAAQNIDADSRYYWRFAMRRLEAEAIRDSILAVSGELSLAMEGRGFDFFKSRGGLSGFPPVEEFSSAGFRRMIYSHKVRMEQVPIFGAFDCPDAGQPMPQRAQSTTPIQALNLWNGAFIGDRAIAMSNRMQKIADDENQHPIELSFLFAIGRKPTDVERQAAAQLVQEHGLESLCRALFNSNEFLFIP